MRYIIITKKEMFFIFNSRQDGKNEISKQSKNDKAKGLNDQLTVIIWKIDTTGDIQDKIKYFRKIYKEM